MNTGTLFALLLKNTAAFMLVRAALLRVTPEQRRQCRDAIVRALFDCGAPLAPVVAYVDLIAGEPRPGEHA